MRGGIPALLLRLNVKVVNQNPLKRPKGLIFVYFKGFEAYLIILGTKLGT